MLFYKLNHGNNVYGANSRTCISCERKYTLQEFRQQLHYIEWYDVCSIDDSTKLMTSDKYLIEYFGLGRCIIIATYDNFDFVRECESDIEM